MPCTNQEERSPQNPTPRIPRSWGSSLQSHKTINVCWLKRLRVECSVGQPRPPKTLACQTLQYSHVPLHHQPHPALLSSSTASQQSVNVPAFLYISCEESATDPPRTFVFCVLFFQFAIFWPLKLDPTQRLRNGVNTNSFNQFHFLLRLFWGFFLFVFFSPFGPLCPAFCQDVHHVSFHPGISPGRPGLRSLWPASQW